MRLAIFGGTFNPIHRAHVAVAEAAFRALALDRLLLVPAAVPPHKGAAELAPAEHRLCMCELAAQGHEGWEVADIDIRRGGPSYSIDTVAAVTERYSLVEPPFFLIGADMLQELDSWYQVDRLVDLCRFAVVARPGSPLDPPAALTQAIGQERAQAICARRVPAPLMDVSSTEIRRRVREGEPIRAWVPEAVEAYIREWGLYRS